jgi:REP element-mobilizing transposase RayT
MGGSPLKRRTGLLHEHRWSQAGGTYFITCCTVKKQRDLTEQSIVAVLSRAVEQAGAQGDVVTLAFTVMPDHVHWLLSLGARLTLGRVIARWKSQTRAALEIFDLHWQRDFFEHRLKPDESVEPYALYVFLNPYRLSLCPSSEA